MEEVTNLLRRVYARTFRPVLGLLLMKNILVLLRQIKIKLSLVMRCLWLLERTYASETNAIGRVLGGVDLSLAVGAAFSDGFDAVDEGAVGHSLEGEPACYVLDGIVSNTAQSL